MNVKIILMNSHDTGTYIEPYRNYINSPNLKQLADEGCLFTNAFTTSPTCSPSRCSLFTSRYPHERGMFGLANMHFKLDSYNDTLITLLNESGYITALAGVQHIAPDSKTIGYTYVLDPGITHNNSEETYSAPYVLGDSFRWDYDNAEAICSFIKHHQHENLFISYGLGNTHRTYSKAETIPEILVLPDGLPDSDDIRKDAADFYKSVNQMDICIGRITEFIKNEHLEEETMIIYTTDHGIAFPNMKCTLHDGGTHISLIINSPECRAGTIHRELVSNLDILPTICDAAGIKPSFPIHGKSLMSLMRKDISISETDHHSYLFSEINYHISYQPMRSIRTDRYKYCIYKHYYPLLSLANIDESPTKRFYMNRGLEKVPQWSEALYDLAYDPNEKNNLVEKKPTDEQSLEKWTYSEIYNDLKEKLESWMKETVDPLVNGPIKQQQGTLVWNNDCIDHTRSHYRRKNL